MAAATVVADAPDCRTGVGVPVQSGNNHVPKNSWAVTKPVL